MKKIYSIAGLTVEMTGQRMLQQIIKFPGFDIFEIEEQGEPDVDIHIHMDKHIDVSDLTDICPIHSFKLLDVNHSFSMCKEGYLFEMHDRAGEKIIGLTYDPQGNTVFISSSESELYIKYAVWIAYFLPAIKREVIPIHASSIVKDSGAVLFLGESGTGKSTHTRLWLKYVEDSYLLNDDSPLLCIKDDKIFVCGSPWSGKTHCYRQEMIPLKAIVRLGQYSENIISRLDILRSIGAVHPSFPPFSAYDKLLSERVIRLIDKIVRDIPVYELKCLPNRDAAEIAYRMIY